MSKMCLSVVSDKIFCESLSVECRLCFTVLRPPSIGRTPEMDELKSPSKQQSERELVYFKLRCRTSSAQSNSAIGAFVALFFYFSLDELPTRKRVADDRGKKLKLIVIDIPIL